MSNGFKQLDASTRWKVLVHAVRKGAESKGYAMKRHPGRGLSNIWDVQRGGEKRIAAIRTTQDRYIAFPPLNGGKKWKTLTDVDLVYVGAVDSKDEPTKVEVYCFDAKEVRQQFDAAYKARVSDGHIVKDNFGLWVNLDPDNRNIASSVGAGIAAKHKPIAVFALDDLIASTASSAVAESHDEVEEGEAEGASPKFSTIADVMAWACQSIAEISGVPASSVKLDLKIQY